MFSVKLVARPDARMVEVPLEIEAELPREFEGAALLAASGLPRKVKIKAARDGLKLSTAYRTDQLVGDIVKSALRGTASDVLRVQEAVTRFIRTVRERRQDGATLLISSNGRGKIDVLEQMPTSPRGVAVTPAEVQRLRPAGAPDRLAAIERRLAELESGFSRIAAGGDLGERMSHVEERMTSLQAELARSVLISEVSGPGFEHQVPGAQVVPRSPGGPRRTTAVEAYAEGLRSELRMRASAADAHARADTERCDKASALAAEAELLGAPMDGTAERLRQASAQEAARQSALERLAEEMEFYAPADLPVAAQLLARLEDGPHPPDPGPSLEAVAQALVRAANGGDCKPRTAWLKRAATLCSWRLVEPARGEPIDPEWHQAIDAGGSTVVRLACPGLKHADGSGVVRARVHSDPAAAQLPEEPDEPAAVPEPLATPAAAFGNLTGEGQIRADKAAAASTASRTPRIVQDDPAQSDEALAAEVALTVATESDDDSPWSQVARQPEPFDPEGPDEVQHHYDVGEDEVEEVVELTEPPPDAEPEKKEPEEK